MDGRVFRILWMSLLVVTLLGCGGDSADDTIFLKISGTTVGKELELTVDALSRFMEENPDVKVYVTPTPRGHTERFALYKDLQGSDIDLLQIDVVWVKALADKALDLKPYVSDEELAKFFPAIAENNTVDGKLVAMPWYADLPVLYYRSDLLKKYGFENPPTTWEELEQMAREIQEGERRGGNLGFWGYVWQGRDYEGLTCNALEWQYSNGGGNFLDEEGRPNLTNAEAVAAFERAASWVGTISPPEVVDWEEEDGRFLWQKGDVAFMRNWTYAYALSKTTAISENVGVAAMPSGPGGAAAVLGGWQLMVSSQSAYPEAAARLARFLAGESEERIRAVQGSQSPALQGLYRDPEVLKAVPFFETFDVNMDSVVARPSGIAGSKYTEISKVYSSAVNAILRGGSAEQLLNDAEAKMAAVLAQ